MQKEFVEGVQKFNAVSLESFKRIAEINSRALQRFTEAQIENVSEYLSGGVKQLEILGQAKSPQEIVAAQVRVATEYNEKTLVRTREAVDILTETRDELKGCFDTAVQDAQDVAKPKTGKKAAR